MADHTQLCPGARVRDAVTARVYGTDNQGTVPSVTGEHAKVRWDNDPTGDAELVHIDDLDAIA